MTTRQKILAVSTCSVGEYVNFSATDEALERKPDHSAHRALLNMDSVLIKDALRHNGNIPKITFNCSVVKNVLWAHTFSKFSFTALTTMQDSLA